MPIALPARREHATLSERIVHEVSCGPGASRKKLSLGTNLVPIALPAGREHATFSENLWTRFRTATRFDNTESTKPAWSKTGGH